MSELASLAARKAPKPPAGLVMARLQDGAVEVAAAGPLSVDDVFELGSVTKVVTGLLLADAVVRGEVELETTLDACLPGARPLRLADLASHTAGLPRLPLALLRRTGLTNTTDPYERTTVAELVTARAPSPRSPRSSRRPSRPSRTRPSPSTERRRPRGMSRRSTPGARSTG